MQKNWRRQFTTARIPHVRSLGHRLSRSAIFAILLALPVFIASVAPKQAKAAPSESSPKQLVIIDTDIGDDIDDAFALALAERSPEFRILGVTTAFGDTAMRAQLAFRFLKATGFGDIPVAVGVATPPKANFTQANYTVGAQFSMSQHRTGPEFLLDQIKKHPNQITLIAIGPQTNLGAAIDKDPATFRKLKRIVMMGGSIDRGYGHPNPEPEWNILCDIPAARKVLASGVPIYMMPLDSTLLRFDPARLTRFFNTHSPLTEQLQILYNEWSAANQQKMPTLFDPMAVAYAIKPDLCPTTPLHLTIDDKGSTLRSPGAPNVNACLKSDPDTFFRFYLSRTTSR